MSVSKKWCYTPEYAQSPYARADHPRGMKWRVPLLVDLEVRLVAYRAYLRDHGLSPVPGVDAPGQGANGFFGFISRATSG